MEWKIYVEVHQRINHDHELRQHGHMIIIFANSVFSSFWYIVYVCRFIWCHLCWTTTERRHIFVFTLKLFHFNSMWFTSCQTIVAEISLKIRKRGNSCENKFDYIIVTSPGKIRKRFHMPIYSAILSQSQIIYIERQAINDFEDAQTGSQMHIVTTTSGQFDLTYIRFSIAQRRYVVHWDGSDFTEGWLYVL